jgi:hypothetical protein
MITKNIIEGLIILEKYRDKPDGYNVQAEHDAIYVYPTNQPVSDDDLAQLITLGWFQEDVHYIEDGFSALSYDPDESWACYT